MIRDACELACIGYQSRLLGSRLGEFRKLGAFVYARQKV